MTAHLPGSESHLVFVNAVRAIDALLPRRRPRPPRVDDRRPYDLDAASDTAAYHAWLERHEQARTDHVRQVVARLRGAPSAPTFGVLVPVHQPDLDLLRRCVDSVLNQAYDRWSLHLCDDASGDRKLTAELDRLSQVDHRIQVRHRSTNGGISVATNDAAAASTDTFLALLDQDDELERGVLADVADHVLACPEADVLYTDQDKLDPIDGRCEPYFKPGWCPDLLLSNMYLGHLLVVRRSLFEQLGGLRPEFDGSQDYDLALRATEQAREIVHVPVVGYHWRRVEGSTALDYQAKPGADQAARRALAEAMDRRGERAAIEDGLVPSTFRVRRVLAMRPKVSVIVPFHDGADLLRLAVDSFVETAGYEHWELLLVDNQSWKPETRALADRLSKLPKTRVLDYPDEFNWSAINNWATQRAAGDLLLFMNSDVEGDRPGWLEAMVEHAQRPEVGAVGARLRYPDGALQHAGVVMGLGSGVAAHPFTHCPPGRRAYFDQDLVIRNWSAVTGACLMTRREVHAAIGGFDEDLAVAYNDVDFCARLRRAGYLVVLTPFADLVHHEGATRGRSAAEAAEALEMFRRWGSLIRRDPYFNPNLDPGRMEFRLPEDQLEEDPWAKAESEARSWSLESGVT